MNLEKTTKYIIYLIFILGAFIPVVSYSLMGIIIINMILLKKEQEIINKLRKNKSILILIISSILSSIFSELWYLSILFSLLLIIKILFSLSVSICFNKKDIRNVVFILMCIGIIVSSIGVFQYYFQIGNTQESWIDSNVYNIGFRVYSTFFNPNIFAIFLNLSIITSVVNFTENNKRHHRFLAAICTILSTLCLLLTYSRGGWLPLCISFMFLSIINKRYAKYAVLFGTIFLGFDYISDVGRLMPQKIVLDSSVSYRIKLWKASLKIIKDNLIFGIGTGTVWNKIPVYSNTIKAYVSHVHNVFLQVLVDTGLVGFVVCIVFVKNIWDKIKLKMNKHDFIGMVSKISFAFYIVLIVNGFFDAVCLQAQISIYIWLLIGINLIDETKNGFNSV